MSLAALYECFDSAPAPAGPGEDWLAGHAAGLAEGRALALAEADTLRHETARAIADLGLSFAEAQGHVLARLAPLFALLADRVVPRLLHETLGAALLDELATAARADAGAPLALCVAPADAAAVEAVLPLLPGVRVAVRADPRLTPGAALIGHGDGESAFDLDRLGRDIAAALAALSDLMQGETRHG